jgi:hypothetical protein
MQLLFYASMKNSQARKKVLLACEYFYMANFTKNDAKVRGN